MTRMRDRGRDTRRCSPHLSLPTTPSAILPPLPRGGSRPAVRWPANAVGAGAASRCPVGVVVPGRRGWEARPPPFRARTTSPMVPRAPPRLRGRSSRPARGERKGPPAPGAGGSAEGAEGGRAVALGPQEEAEGGRALQRGGQRRASPGRRGEPHSALAPQRAAVAKKRRFLQPGGRRKERASEHDTNTAKEGSGARGHGDTGPSCPRKCGGSEAGACRGAQRDVVLVF